jgi:hypothetical protein
MSIEPFKAIDQIFESDRPGIELVLDPGVESGWRPYTLADLHRSLSDLTLSPAVPEHVQNAYLTARHLLLYSWFVYRFIMVAQLQAFAALEYGLRERLGYGTTHKPPTLRRLLDEAVDRGLLDERRIRDWPGHRGAKGDAVPTRDLGWLRKLAEAFPVFRNDLAHGSFSLYPDQGRSLRIVADILNQLYPAGLTEANGRLDEPSGERDGT